MPLGKVLINPLLTDLEELSSEVSNLFDTLHCVLQVSPEVDTTYDSEIKTMMQELIDLKQDTVNLHKATSLTKEEVLKLDRDGKIKVDEEDINKMLKTFMDESSQQTRKEIKEIKLFEELEKTLNSRENDADIIEDDFNESGDLFISERIETYTDPISKTRITNPVKSRYCNHYFEKTVILPYLSNKCKKCPYIGCVKYVAAKDLVEDLALKKKLLETQHT